MIAAMIVDYIIDFIAAVSSLTKDLVLLSLHRAA